ncbi:YitT family protein [Frigoribacterium sp. PhB160]|uniref:YitT family protein n=1 Tax=Frigoribacterium sp. PhB160 TaxID=2485192 RepID=UPI001F366259|nr:YitT family protein [Frigoribacterium sp. PhB160]
MTEVAATADANRHTLAENVMGVITGVFIASFGLFLLKESGAVSGGTAGLALLISYATPVSFGLLFLLVNVPFFALALWKKGLAFTLRTVLTVAMVSAFSYLHPLALGIGQINPVYGTLGGNLLIGVGLLILFRHGASLGGINILALILQEKLGWRAGYVQMVVDVVIVLVSLTVVSPWVVLVSAAGAVVLNLVLALNHKQGRYLGRT